MWEQSSHCLRLKMSLGFILDMRRCFLANLRSEEISEFQGLQTHLSVIRKLTGSLHRISVISSNGRLGSGGDIWRTELPGGLEEEEDGGGGKVRVLAVVVDNCRLFEVVSTVSGWDQMVSFLSSPSLPISPCGCNYRSTVMLGLTFFLLHVRVHLYFFFLGRVHLC